MGFSPPLVSAFEFKQQVKLPKEEFEKRVIKYINTPEELRIYLPDIIHEEEDVDPVDFCNVSKEVKDLIPNRKLGDSSKYKPLFKNTNTVVFDMVEGISQVEVKDLSGAMIKLFDTYQVPRGNYPTALLCAQNAEKLRALAQGNYELIEGHCDPGEISPTWTVLTRNGRIGIRDLLYVINAGTFTWDGDIDYDGTPTRSYLSSIDNICDGISKEFYMVEGYLDLDVLNGMLQLGGQPLFTRPSLEYMTKHPTYNALIRKSDPRVAYLESTASEGGRFSISKYLKPAEVRKLNAVGNPITTKKENIRSDFTIHGFGPDQFANMYKQRTYEQVVNKVEYGAGVAMLVFAIINLILAWVYK
jgi:hypothetical protein